MVTVLLKQVVWLLLLMTTLDIGIVIDTLTSIMWMLGSLLITLAVMLVVIRDNR